MKWIGNQGIINRLVSLFLVGLVAFVGAFSLNVAANHQGYYFDDTLLLGSSSSLTTLENLALEQAFLPGRYQVDLYLNGKYIANEAVDFAELVDRDGVASVVACFTPEMVGLLNIKADYLRPVSKLSCTPLTDYMPKANVVFNLPNLRLDITIAQAYLIIHPQGYIDPALWDQGESMLFANYTTSSYYNSFDRTNSHFIGLNLGANYKTWRLNQLRNYTYNSFSGWQGNIANSYLTKAIEPIRSQLIIGENYTNSSFFSSTGFRGIQLRSDERMLPDNLIGYAPVIHGVASTNANVVIKQSGYIIYQMTVVAGPFVINDLNPISYGGDLFVEVHESNGEISTFSVPFTIAPQAVREGASRYNTVIGRVRDGDKDDDYFAELNYQYGLSSRLTVNSATRISNGYYALMAGNSLNSAWGAFSLNLNYSNIKQDDQSHKNGWMGRLSYNKSITNTGTSLTINSYHYAKRNYLELNEYFSCRNNRGGCVANDPQRFRVEISLNQSLNNFGSLYFSGSVQSYFSNHRSDKQLQLSYSNNWRGSSYGLTLNRAYLQSSGQYENILSLNLFMPLFSSETGAYLNNHVIKRSDGGTGFQTSVSGLTSQDKTTSLNFNLTRQDDDKGLSWGAGLQKNFSLITLNGQYSQNSENRQASLNTRGAVVAHRGGLTLGQYLGDSFVLVEAVDAAGTKVLNSPGVEIDRFGYALLPSVAPYRKNRIILDPSELDVNTELVENQKRIIPYAGIAARVSFTTITGYPVLIRSYRPNGDVIPLSALVYDNNQVIIGNVGQRGQIYFRATTLRGELLVRWGSSEDQSCRLEYELSDPDPKQVLHTIEAICN